MGIIIHTYKRTHAHAHIGTYVHTRTSANTQTHSRTRTRRNSTSLFGRTYARLRVGRRTGVDSHYSNNSRGARVDWYLPCELCASSVPAVVVAPRTLTWYDDWWAVKRYQSINTIIIVFAALKVLRRRRCYFALGVKPQKNSITSVTRVNAIRRNPVPGIRFLAVIIKYVHADVIPGYSILSLVDHG